MKIAGTLVFLVIILMQLVICSCDDSEETVTFPDSNLEAAIREAIDKPTGDISKSDVEELTRLEATNIGIKDIAGIEICTGLTVLWLDGNEISDIAPISSLAGLKDLSLWRNNVSDISPIAGLTSLTDLAFSDNIISDVTPLSNLVNLKVLGIHTNHISDISPISNLISLTNLGLGTNEITDISALSNLVNLEVLGLGGNQITDISPLVENEGFGDGDVIDLLGNPLNEKSISEYIPQLTERGTSVRLVKSD